MTPAKIHKDLSSKVLSQLDNGNIEEAIRLLVRENSIQVPEDILKYVKKYRTKKQEHFLSILLDGAHKVIKIVEISKGLVNKTLVHPREVFRSAIENNACAIIIAHNHPSGSIEFSSEDIEITKRLKEAGNIIGIDILDHILISKIAFVSLLTQSGELFA